MEPDWRSLSIELVNDVKAKHRRSVKNMALRAGCSGTALGEALNGRPGRNLAVHWVLAQGPEFVADFFDAVTAKLKLKPAAQRRLRPQEIGAIVRELIAHVGRPTDQTERRGA